MTTVLVTGSAGMLGTDLVRVLDSVTTGFRVVAATRQELDITDATAVADAVSGVDVIVNAAAYTRVDDAEDDEDTAFAVNAAGPRNLAAAAAARGARLIQISTDYVFDGQATVAYPEDAPLNPVSAYGRTKAAGEVFVRRLHPDGSIVLRTAWLYGENGPSFVRTMLRLAAEGSPVTVVDDQHGQPTWSADVAGKVAELIASPIRSGTFHATSTGEVTWFGFARRIFEEAGYDPDMVEPVDSARFARRARRPAFSVLGHGGWRGTGIRPIRDWRDALSDALGAGAFGVR